MFLPHEVLACSLSIANMFCSSIAAVIAAFLVRTLFGVVGVSGVPNRICVAPVGFPAHAFCSSVASVVARPLAKFGKPLPLGGGFVRLY